MKPRVLFHVQHLLGIGHFRRAAHIARALSDAGAEVTLASGGAPLPDPRLGKVQLAQLPVAQAADRHFSALMDETGQEVGEAWKNRRRDILLQLFADIAPDILIVELYPFGRRNLAFELAPLLAAAHARPNRPIILCSLRDILVRKPNPAKDAAIAQQARWLYDHILVHGDPAIARLEDSFSAASSLTDRLIYTGYVTDPSAPGGIPDHGNGGDTGMGDAVLVSAGGGAVGADLLHLALQAQRLTQISGPWRLLGGWQLPAHEVAEIQTQAAAQQVIFERHRPDFVDLLRHCHVSVSQAGYNTVMEILSTRTRAVVVPFAAGAETEQTLRAEILARRDLLTLLPEAGLTAARLAAAIDAAAARDRPAGTIDLNGAAQTVQWIMAQWNGRGRQAG